MGKHWNPVPELAVSAIWRSQTSESAFSVGMHAFPGRKDSFIHGNATSQSEFGQDNGLTRNTGGCPHIFTGDPGIITVPTTLKLHLTPAWIRDPDFDPDLRELLCPCLRYVFIAGCLSG